MTVSLFSEGFPIIWDGWGQIGSVRKFPDYDASQISSMVANQLEQLNEVQIELTEVMHVHFVGVRTHNPTTAPFSELRGNLAQLGGCLRFN